MSSNVIDSVLSGAQSIVAQGVPYLWGGVSLAGMDCSGMIYYLYQQVGITLPRTSEGMATAGTAVASLAQASPGDLILYGGNGGDYPDGVNSHVALYAGVVNGVPMQYAETTAGTVASEQPVDVSHINGIRNVSGETASATSTTTASITPPATYSLEGNAQYALAFFMQNGYTLAQAAGIVGNFIQESGVNPEQAQIGGGPGMGIAQWSVGGRWQSGLATGNNATDLQAQLQYVLTELNGSYSNANTALKAATDPQSAAQVFGTLYEGYGIEGNRVADAQAVYDLANGTASAAEAAVVGATASTENIWSNIGKAIGGYVLPGSGGSNPVTNISDLYGAIETALSPSFWSKVALFAGGVALFIIGLAGFIATTNDGREAATVAAVA